MLNPPMGFVMSSEVFPSRHPTSPLDGVFPSCSWPDLTSHDRGPSTRSIEASRLLRRRVVSDIQTGTCAFTASCHRLNTLSRLECSGERHSSVTSRPSPRLSSTVTLSRSGRPVTRHRSLASQASARVHSSRSRVSSFCSPLPGTLSCFRTPPDVASTQTCQRTSRFRDPAHLAQALAR
jgi:hypothetical protein